MTRNIDAEFQKQYRTAPFREFRLTAFIAAPLLSLGFFPLPSFAFLTRINVTFSPLFLFLSLVPVFSLRLNYYPVTMNKFVLRLFVFVIYPLAFLSYTDYNTNEQSFQI